MAKTYEIKVYDQENNFITTWTDVISDISFSNEINSAGGQLQLTLGRNAGDYGEGTDVSFGYKVQVYCFDIEEPNGLLVFQGYISAYTPIYKDDKVQVTVLGYGSELNDYIIEAGGTPYITQTSQNKTYPVGEAYSMGSDFKGVIQTFTVAADTTVSAATIMVTNPSTQTYSVVLFKYNGVTPDIMADNRLAFGVIGVGASSAAVTKVVFDTTADLLSSEYYYLLVFASEGAPSNSTIHATNTNPYADGKIWTAYFSVATWYVTGSVAADDLYFILEEYGGNTTASYTSEEPIDILKDILGQYNSQGGAITEPLLPYTPLVGSLLKGTTQNTSFWGCAYAQVFEVSTNTKINAIQLYINGSAIENSEYVEIYQGNPDLDTTSVMGGGFNYYPDASNTLITSTTLNATTGKYEFLTPPTLTAGVSYYFLLQYGQFSPAPSIQGASTSDLPILTSGVGKQYRSVIPANNLSGSMGYDTTYPALYFNIYYIDPIPTDINGGYVNTGTSVSYTYKVNTILEGINILKDLSPENWYWYIDQGRNELFFKEKSEEPEHIFSLEKDLIDAKFEKRTEDIVNTVYFTGGAVSPGVNYYKKYVDANSISLYGVKSIKYSDTNVITDATADIIGNNIISSRSQPELRVTLEILDSNNNQGVGYDIESLQVGDVIAVRNITQQVGLSSWDIARWDEAYWDYNIYNLSSLRMQIEKIQYNEDTATVMASNIPVDINKRVDQLNKAIQAQQTLNNPAAPS
jgi:hypothetical protein